MSKASVLPTIVPLAPNGINFLKVEFKFITLLPTLKSLTVLAS